MPTAQSQTYQYFYFIDIRYMTGSTIEKCNRNGKNFKVEISFLMYTQNFWIIILCYFTKIVCGSILTVFIWPKHFCVWNAIFSTLFLHLKYCILCILLKNMILIHFCRTFRSLRHVMSETVPESLLQASISFYLDQSLDFGIKKVGKIEVKWLTFNLPLDSAGRVQTFFADFCQKRFLF